MQIGQLTVDPPVISAPMAGFTNFAYREILRSFGGPGLITTEMVSARSFVYLERAGEDHPDRLWGVRDEPRPLSVQIWDNDPDTLAAFGKKLAEDYRVSVVDLNFGCPAKAIAQRVESGSYLLKDPERLGAIVENVVKACGKVPVTAKIRLGWTKDTINAVDIAQAVESAGGAALTVHGRTAKDMYSGNADWDEIAKIKPHLKKIPLIGNGDINSVETALHRLKNYPVDGIMIGRAGLVKPWMFRQISQALTGNPVDPEPTMFEQCELLLRHFDLLLKRFGPQIAVVLMQKYACNYSHGKPGARMFRSLICSSKTVENFLEIVREHFPVET